MTATATNGRRPERYLLDLVDLGRAGARMCMATAELDIAISLNPVGYVRPTCSMVGINAAGQRLTCVFGLGGQSASDPSADPA
jgi:hypothetical protein